MHSHTLCPKRCFWHLGLVLLSLGAVGFQVGVLLGQEGEEESGFRVPPGFEIRLFAPDQLAHNIFSMTVDHQGHVIVAGPKYVKRLVDEDGDGRADRAVLLSQQPGSGAHGLYLDDQGLVFTGDNVVGFLPWAPSGQKLQGPVQVWTHLRHPEHGANGVLRGPDGWWYIICGNDAQVDERHVGTPFSPVRQVHNGAIVRIGPGGKPIEVLAHGFRNPYDAAFWPWGALLLVDADGERDHHLPWYAPNRLFDVAWGVHHGWVLQGWRRSWNRPPWFPDVAPWTFAIGRGSPTGAVVYRHWAFPRRYHNGLFTCCWTLGRVYFFRLEVQGAELRARREVFLESVGHTGLAPVDVAVGPQGEMYVAVGGRGTRGSVFVIRYQGPKAPVSEPKQPSDPLALVLQAPQPLSAWSRARWVPLARHLGPAPFAQVVLDPNWPELCRVRAVEVLVECFAGVPLQLRKKLAGWKPDSPRVQARLAWALGLCHPQDRQAVELLCRWSETHQPWVARWTWEALLRCDPQVAQNLRVQPRWDLGLASPWRRVRLVARTVARRWGVDHFPAPADSPYHLARTLANFYLQAWRLTRVDERFLRSLLELWQSHKDVPTQLELVRLVQLGCGDIDPSVQKPDVLAGYTFRWHEQLSEQMKREIATLVAERFPSGDRALDYELARVACALRHPVPQMLDLLARKWTNESSPVDDVHWLICAAGIPGSRSGFFRRRCAEAVLRLPEKMSARGMHPSRNWPLRVGEAVKELLRHDEQLGPELIRNPLFRLPEQAGFALLLPKKLRAQAARVLLGRWSDRDDPQQWTAELILLVSHLPPEEALPVLRPLAQEPALRDLVVVQMARWPRPEDRQVFVQALSSPQPHVVQAAAEALTSLSAQVKESELAAALGALGRSAPYRELAQVRQALHRLLWHWVFQDRSPDSPAPVRDGKALLGWWLEQIKPRWPQVATQVAASSARNLDQWRKRLRRIEWSSGDADRGKVVFERLRCHLCHRGVRRLGPDLAGVAQRFAPLDLMMAIVDPSRDVAPLYRTKMVLTRSGQVFYGLVVYESPEGTLLQTGPETTVRFSADQVEQIVPSARSLMPEGLLDQATDQDLADLYAYLRSLKK